MIVVLAGGVGAARFLRGVVRAVPPEEVTVVSNTGDDARVYGLHVSPDVDIVTYTLAGRNDEERGWGLAGDTRAVMEGLRALGREPWFSLGDRDLATSLARTLWLAEGAPLSETAARIARALGVRSPVLPMTDDPVETRVLVASEGGEQDIHFQEYWVGRGAADRVLGVRLAGAETARPGPGVLESISEASAILVAPSNPVVSIGTILQIPGVRPALREARAPVVGVSPIVGGAVVRGMADRLMPAVGAEVSALGVARLYRDFLNGFVIDTIDSSLAPGVAALGIEVESTGTIMGSAEEAAALARTCLALAARIAR